MLILRCGKQTTYWKFWVSLSLSLHMYHWFPLRLATVSHPLFVNQPQVSRTRSRSLGDSRALDHQLFHPELQVFHPELQVFHPGLQLFHRHQSSLLHSFFHASLAASVAASIAALPALAASPAVAGPSFSGSSDVAETAETARSRRLSPRSRAARKSCW